MMKYWKRLLALFLSGVMALSLFACNSDPTNKTTSGDPSDSPSPYLDLDPDASTAPEIEADLSQTALEFSAGLSPTDVLLTVNGVDVKADLFCYLLGQACGQTQQYLSVWGMSLGDMPDMAPDLLEQGVQLALYHSLIRQKAAELGCLLTDEQRVEIRTAMDEADLENAAPLWDLTDESIQFIFEMNYYYENLYNAVTHEPSTDELNGYLYRVKHILVKTVDDSMTPLPEEEIAGKKTQAEDLLAQLQAADDLPAKFDELMNEYSEDRAQDGTLNGADGYLAGPGEMVAEFETASKALKDGELSGLVESTYGYHIILRLPTDVTEEELADSEYADNFRMDALEEQMDQWIEEADVTRADALSGLNAVDFYVRLAAYQQALSEQQQADAPEESGSVG